MHSPDDKEFPIVGTKASRELHHSISEGPGNFLSYHAEWLRLSGVSGKSSSAHIHRNLCEALRLMHSYDQIDASSLASAETLSRWMIQVELAVERSPTSPDYSGLDIVAGTATLPDGRASTSKFNEWVSSKLKERASVWSGRGGYHDESDDDEDGPGPRKGKKTKKKKGKGDKSEQAAGSGAGGGK